MFNKLRRIYGKDKKISPQVRGLKVSSVQVLEIFPYPRLILFLQKILRDKARYSYKKVIRRIHTRRYLKIKKRYSELEKDCSVHL